MLKNLIGKLNLGRHQWSESEIEKYLGTFSNIYSSYSRDEKFGKFATSGGSVTAMLDFAIKSRLIAAALVLKSRVESGEVKTDFILAESSEDLISAQGSKYISVKFGNSEINKILEYPGNIGVVLLPCDTAKLRRAMERNTALKNKVIFIITLVCGHNSRPELTSGIIKSFKKTDSPLVDFSYRTGYWLGDLTAKFQDGTVIKKTAEKFLDYQNLYFFCEEKCHSCHDHFGYQSDISAGDIWNYNRFKKSPQSTALICRTEIGELLVNNTFKAGKIHLETESAKEILDGQSRTLPFHYNTSARSVVGRLFGFRVKDTVNQKIYWNMYIVTFMALFNDYCSRTRLGRSIIFLIPNKIIKLYLYAFKLLEVLKK